jgi:alkylation response protein AidB-like acyl-CoA dehydrogenase
MPSYTPPLRDMRFVLHEVLDVVGALKRLPAHAEVDAETIDAVLEEGGKFASEVLAPAQRDRRRRGLRARQGDPRGQDRDRLQGGVREVRRGRLAGAQLRSGVRRPGLPHVVNQCLFEMLNSANQAWTMYPGLSHGAYECLHAYGTDEQKQLYLGKLTSGHWTGRCA